VARTISSPVDEHDLARQLVALRSLLARRAQLSLHPALPPGARSAFEENLRTSINRYQRELEDAYRRDEGSGRLDRQQRDRMLAVIRRHPFTAVLDFTLAQDGSRLSSTPLTDSPRNGLQRSALPPRRWRHVTPQTPEPQP
jgi:hypothetical protein